MSWFGDLAGKAEDLLNRVDQRAATLSVEKRTPETSFITKILTILNFTSKIQTYQTGSRATYIPSAADNIRNQKATSLAGTANVKVGSRTLGETSHPVKNVSASRPSSQLVQRKKSEPDNELLFDFNSSQKKTTESGNQKRAKIPVLQSTRTSIISSVNINVTTIKTIEKNPLGAKATVVN